MVHESTKTVLLGVSGVTFSEVIDVARHHATVVISPEAIAAIAKTRKYIDEYAAGGVPVYGVSTGFGALPIVTLM